MAVARRGYTVTSPHGTVKAKAAADVFRPASAIIEEVLLEQMTDGPCSSLRRPEYITRAAKRKRQQL